MIPTALHWRTQSIPAIPLHPSSKRPLIPWRRYQSSLPSIPNLISWFSRPANLAVITGGPRNLVILDYDTEVTPDLPLTYTIKTSRGSHHYYFTDSPTPTMLAGDVEVKGNRAYCCAPPSVHPSGHPYAVLVDAPITQIGGISDIVDIPADLAAPPTPHTEPQAQALPKGSVVARLKALYPIITLLSHYTHPFPSDPSGRWYAMRCPHPDHDDRNPSFWADSLHGLCGCHKPRCRATQPGGKTMDVINLFGWLEGCGNKDAIRELMRR